MRRISGVILNNDIFINSSHVVKIEKVDDKNSIYIYMNGIPQPIILSFESISARDEKFPKIIMELYGYDYSVIKT